MLSHEQLQDMAAQLFEEHLDGKNDDPSLALARAVEAATLATVTPLVQQQTELLEKIVLSLRDTALAQYGDENRADAWRYMRETREAIGCSRAFLSGATKESTDA